MDAHSSIDSDPDSDNPASPPTKRKHIRQFRLPGFALPAEHRAIIETRRYLTVRCVLI